MRQHYFPESVNVWEQVLLQSGAGQPIFIGTPYQRGQGIGSFFRGLFCTIWPTIKKVGLAVGKEALRTGSEVTRDYLQEGQDPKTALKKRARRAAGRTMTKLGAQMQGESLGSRPHQKLITGMRTRRRQRAPPDIF